MVESLYILHATRVLGLAYIRTDFFEKQEAQLLDDDDDNNNDLLQNFHKMSLRL